MAGLCSLPWYMFKWLVACSVPCHGTCLAEHAGSFYFYKDMDPHMKNTQYMDSICESKETAGLNSHLISE